MQGVTEGLIRFHRVHKDFEVVVEVCQVGARFEALEILEKKSPPPE